MPSVLDSLDDNQKRDAILNEGNTLVIANPGTGKTTTIAYKYAHLIEKGISPEKILCLTFTEKAKEEMEKRILEICSASKLNLDISKLNIHTFHGFAYSYLKDKFLEMDKEILESDTERQYAIFNYLKKANAFNYGDDYLISAIIPAISENIRFLKSYNVLPISISRQKAKEILNEKLKGRRVSYSKEEMEKLTDYFIDAFGHYEKWKEKRYLDFNDLNIEFVSRFNENDAFDFVLVDELQDVNNMEAEMSLKAGKTKFAVGDKKQAIFGFQGGAYSNFDKFSKIGKSFNLGKNRRSLQMILDYSSAFILKNSKNAKHFKEELSTLKSTRENKGEKIELIVSSDPSAAVASLMGQAKGKKIGIIARKNSQLVNVSKALDASGIGYESYSQNTISENAKNEIRVYLKSLLSFSKEDKVKGLFTPFASVGLDRALEISKNSKDYTMEEIQGMLFSGRIIPGIDFVRLAFEQKILPCSIALGHDYFMAASLIYNRLLGHMGDFNDSLDSESFDNFIMLITDTLENQNRESDISLLTVHKAKGSEYDVVVYLPELSSREKVPALKMIAESILESKGINATEEVEEEDLRIDFVAFTRAKEKLFVIIPDERDKNRMMERYFVPECSSIRDLNVSESQGNGLEMKYSEAWKHFVSKDYEGAKKLLDSEERVWLLDSVKNHFYNIKHLSYSSVSSLVKDPYGYLLGKVLNVSPFSRAVSESMDFGKKMHSSFESYAKGVNVSSMFSEEEEKTTFDNFLKCLEDIKKAKGEFKFKGTEVAFSSYAKDIFGVDSNVLFKGFTDAILEVPDGYLIIDYKTNTSESTDNSHMKQLELYKRMFAFTNNIELSKIDTAVVYVSLQDKINTGRMWHKVVFGSQKGGKLFDDFTDDISLFLNYSKDPVKFLDYAFEKGPGYGSQFGGYLFDSLKSQWQMESGKG